MSWRDLLAVEEHVVLPWLGGSRLTGPARSWTIAEPVPPEVGWHRFRTDGSRRARWDGPAEPDWSWEQGRTVVRGYLVDDRLVPDDAAVHPDPARLVEQTVRVWLVEPGLERFARVAAARADDGQLVYLRPEFPLGPEPDAQDAWEEGRADLSGVKGVTPALDLSFRWQRWQVDAAAARREAVLARVAAEEAAAAERARVEAEEAAILAELEAEAREQARAAGWRVDPALRRRILARRDFRAAATEALALSGAELLDSRLSVRPDERVVRFRFHYQRFECVVHATTLRVVDSGICLLDNDDRFTLESLPGVIDEAERTHRLVVTRHPGRQ